MPDHASPELLIFRNRSVAGGVNGFVFATDINDDQAVELTNVDASIPGLRTSREGLSLMATGITFGPILALSPFQAVNKESELLAISPGATYPNAANLRLWSWDGKSPTWSLVGQLTGLTSATMGLQIVVGMDFQSIASKPYIARIFYEDNQQVAYVYDGTALGMTNSAQAVPVAGMFPAAFQANRCIASGRGTSRALLFPSDVGLFAMTGFNAGISLTMGGGYRQLVRAIYPFRNDKLIVFMADRTDALLMSDASLAVNSGSNSVFTDWSRELISARIGCAGHLAVTDTGDDLLFADQHGNIRSLQQTITDNEQGVRGPPVSAAIQPYIDRINPAAMRKVAATFFNRFAFFGFPLDSATEVSHTFVFDVVNKSWSGPWIGRFPGKVMAVAALSDPSASAKFQYPSLYVGSSDTDAGRVYHAFDGETDNGDPIGMQEVSKRYTFDQLETPKFFRRLYDLWEASGSENVQLEARIDGRDWTSIGAAESVIGDTPTLPVTFPFDLGGSGIVRGSFSLEKFGETPYDLQLRFTVTCSTQVKHMGYTLLAHSKNLPWKT